MSAPLGGFLVLATLAVIAFVSDLLAGRWERKQEEARVDAMVSAHPSGALGVARDEIAVREACEQLEAGIFFARIYCQDCGKAYYTIPCTPLDANRAVLAATPDAVLTHQWHRATECQPVTA